MIHLLKLRTCNAIFLFVALIPFTIHLCSGRTLSNTQYHARVRRHSNEDESAVSNNSRAYSHGLKTMIALVLVDDSTVRFHGKNKIDMYVLTIMSLVDEAFHHPSLGVTIEVWLRRVHFLTPAEFKQINFKRDVSRSLNDFCELAHKIRYKSYSKDRIDVFVLLTRAKFGPAGYAPVGSVCSAMQNCIMVQDRGLSSAYVLAHEIGHTLGMDHDGDKNSCRREPQDGKIMATKVLSNYYRHYWTSCSRKAILQTLLLATCLDELPDLNTNAKRVTKEYTYSYGITWDQHEQCRQEFGNGFWGCPNIPDEYMCEKLSCKNYNTYARGCVTKNYPAIPKTICGPRHWCQDFNCLEMNAKKQDGGWSEWRDWTVCSRTCGGGFQKRNRKCNDPRPTGKGRWCRGQPDEYRVCNFNECPYLSDFRAEQCKEFNEINRAENLTHNWLPVENKNKSLQCKLTCTSEQHGTQMIERAKDGTFCSYENPSNRCFKGSCKEIGCAGLIHSKVKEDKCGVCGGDGRNCKKISGQVYIELALNDYHNLVILPKHARTIVIREQYSETHTSHFFALKDTSTDKWFLNGGQNFSGNRQLVVNGALFIYTNDFTGESLKARGPLMDPVNLMVYSKSNKALSKLFYRFFLHKDVYSDPQHRKYDWRFSDWSRCSKTCEKGYQYKVFKCMEGRIERESEHCSNKLLPVVQRLCNTQSCSLKHWWVPKSSYRPCSVSCGVGVQMLRMKCMAVIDGRVRKRPVLGADEFYLEDEAAMFDCTRLKENIKQLCPHYNASHDHDDILHNNHYTLLNETYENDTYIDSTLCKHDGYYKIFDKYKKIVNYNFRSFIEKAFNKNHNNSKDIPTNKFNDFINQISHVIERITAIINNANNNNPGHRNVTKNALQQTPNINQNANIANNKIQINSPKNTSQIIEAMKLKTIEIASGITWILDNALNSATTDAIIINEIKKTPINKMYNRSVSPLFSKVASAFNIIHGDNYKDTNSSTYNHT